MDQQSGERLLLPAVILACFGCLQTGIDPVFLTILSSAHGVPVAAQGWIVSATQTGMAIGSVLTWRWGSTFPVKVFVVAAIAAILASLATPHLGYLPALLIVRSLYGFAMGVLYTQGVSQAAANRPHGAYGAVFLAQLLLSTIIALVLPEVNELYGARAALSALALVPLGALIILLISPVSTMGIGAHNHFYLHEDGESSGAYAWTVAFSSLLFICATMMVWTFAGALAVGAGISEEAVGRAVALGSLAGAGTAFLVMQERTRVPPTATGVLAGLSLVSPIAAVHAGGTNMFIAAIVLLNIGSTAIIVRTSGLASASGHTALFRRFVACVHALGMIMGPLIGSSATVLFGESGLLIAAIATIFSACLLLAIAMEIKGKEILFRSCEESLDEILTNVQS